MRWNADADVQGTILILSFAPLVYNLSVGLLLDGSTRASEVRLYGHGSTVLRAPQDASSLLTMLPGAPPVSFHGLTLHGRLDIRAGRLQIDDCRLERSRSASDGGALSLTGGKVEARNTSFLNNEAGGSGGAVHVDGGEMLLEDCLLEGNTAAGDGGALHVRSGSATLRTRTLLKGNVAAGDGNSIYTTTNGSIIYTLPCPFGRWISLDTCASESASTTADSVQVASTNDDYPFACAPGLYGDSLDAQSSPSCSGSCHVGHFCPSATVSPIVCGEGSFCPGYDASGRGATAELPCPVGTFSSATRLTNADECTRAEPGFFAPTGSVAQTPCAAGTVAPTRGLGVCEPCPPGWYQPLTGSTICRGCERGSYCPVGASAALPCKKGFYSNATNLTDPSECLICPAGMACSTGSIEPVPCFPGTHAPIEGMARCMYCESGTYQPYWGRSECFGLTTTTTTRTRRTVRTQLTLDMSIDGYNSTALRHQLAAAYGIGAELISVDLNAGSLVVTLTIAESDSQSSNSSQSIDSIMAAVEAIGDEALGSALNVSVTSEPVMIVNQTYNVSETAGSCSPGYYCPVGATSPLPCPGGTRSDPSMPYMTLESDCIACKQGTACSLGSSQETNCSAGTYNDAVRQVQCVTCPSGKYQNEAGATVCLDCPVTRFCPEGTATPIACPPGTINTETGASSPDMCLDCPSGYWCTGGDRVPCTKDTYNPVVSTASTDQSACLSCPDDSTTDGQQNASSVASCLCKVDFYDAAEEPDAVDCEACPSGSDCSAVGNTLVTLPVKRGYYRIDDTDDDVRRCPDAAINCTAASECAESTSGCHGTVEPRRSSPASGFFSANTSLNCYEDLTGVFCRLCRDRADGKHVYYRSATRIARAQCVECREVARDTILSFFGLSVLAILFVLLLVYVYDAYVSERRKRLVRYAWWRFKPHNKIKILIGFYQVATKIGYVYEVELPPAVVQLLSYIATGVSLGFSITDRLLQCLGMRGYFAKLSLYMAFPFALSFLILLGALVRMVTSNQCNRDTLVDICVPPMLRLGFLAYPLVTTLAFDAFTCYHFTKSEWLRADVAIQCDTSQHSEAKALAWVAICLYPVGLFVINAALLYAARKAIVSKRPTTLSKAISFLHAEYDLTLFWWELVELFRRFVLVGVMVLGQGSMMQLVIGTLLAAVFLLFQVQASPYADISDSFLASVASFALVAVFLCATAFKYIALTDLGDIRAKMSREQRELYQVNAAILTVIVFASVFAALVFSCVLFLVQLRFEDARIRKEARTSKARRLRYKDGQHEVHAPPIEERGFHALLSHVSAPPLGSLRTPCLTPPPPLPACHGPTFQSRPCLRYLRCGARGRTRCAS